MKEKATCSEPNCDGPAKARGLCQTCYDRRRRSGTLPYKPTGADAFWAKVDRSGGPDACWPWLRARHPSGYGAARINRVNNYAHRVAYELAVGPIPDGLVIDHLCRNRGCVNPAHMEPVTNTVNVLRGESVFAQRARQTHCHRGHEFTEANTRIHNGTRECRACDALRAREKRKAKLARQEAQDNTSERA